MADRTKIAVVTGSNKGIGYYIAKGLLAKGYSVVLACRDTSLAAKAADKLMSEAGVKELKRNDANPIRTVRFDLEDVASLDAAAQEVSKMYPDGIDAIVHNAGFAFKTDATEPFGVQADKTTTINYFNTKHAAQAFMPVVRDGGRVVFVASRAGYLNIIKSEELRSRFIRKGATQADIDELVKNFVSLAKEGKHRANGWPDTAYGMSKLALCAHARLLSYDTELRKRHITVNWCCPGWCKTDMAGDEAARTPEEGADTPVWLATSDEVKDHTGRFYGERNELDWVNSSGF
jgi:carbonyl reductase 1